MIYLMTLQMRVTRTRDCRKTKFHGYLIILQMTETVFWYITDDDSDGRSPEDNFTDDLSDDVTDDLNCFLTTSQMIYLMTLQMICLMKIQMRVIRTGDRKKSTLQTTSQMIYLVSLKMI